MKVFYRHDGLFEVKILVLRFLDMLAAARQQNNRMVRVVANGVEIVVDSAEADK
jgi:hypothetical protein